MCGIAGELSFGPEVQGTSIAAMTDALVHRGPDGVGVWTEGRVGLGQRRLAIIDLSDAGRNPLWTHDRSAAIVFNGELYNYRELRTRLVQEGCTLQTATDTEVVLVAVQHWGVAHALSQMIGMFAFAVWDVRAQRLTLARDRIGVKPLFYARQGERLLFGSEMRALYAHPAYQRTLNQNGLGQFFVLGYTAGETTALKETWRVPAGHYLEATPDGQVRISKYWSLDPVRRGTFTGTFEDAANAFEALATDAFAYRLVSDVPVGVFLSGGIDSTFLAAVLKHKLQQDLLHITIGFREKRYDEAPMATEIARQLGVRHHVEYLDAPDAAAALRRFTEIYDEPFGDSSGMPTAMVSAIARQHVKVALSADGGDEQFCGYESYSSYAHRFASVRRWPLPLRRVAARLLSTLPLGRLLSGPAARKAAAGGSPRLISSIEKGLALLDATSARDVVQLMSTKGWSSRRVAELIGAGVGDVWAGTVFASEALGGGSEAELIDGMMRVDFQAFMRDDVLVKVDRASMAASLECRDPFVDHRLAEFAFSLPMDFHLSGGVHKRLLKFLLARHIAPEVLRAPKRGFVVPLYEWMRGPWRPLVDQYLSPEMVGRVGVLDPAVVRREVDRFYRYPGIGAERVQLLLNFQMWAERWYRA